MKIKFGVFGLDHGHVYGMIKGLLETGQAEGVSYFSEDKSQQAHMQKNFPSIPLAQSKKEVLDNPEIQIICCAAINNQRGPLAAEIMRHKKDVFIDKPAVTTFEQLDEIIQAQKETGQSWFVYYGERLADPCTLKAFELIKEGAIGRVVNFIGLGPHKLNRPTRPAWMLNADQYGGIINDIGIHQIETFTQLCGAKPEIVSSRVGNFANTDIPTFQDFGDATLVAPNGMTGYIRIDWYSPEKMQTYGDVRNFIVGTRGMIEIRKTIDFTIEPNTWGRQLFFASHDTPPQRIACQGMKVPFFNDFIKDIQERKNRVIPHDLSFAACRATLEAQTKATVLKA